MERIESTNADRITWCCQQFGITPHELAAEVGISEKTMDRAMADEAALTFAQLKRIADFFGRGVLFFLEQDAVEEQNVYTPQFRTLTNQKPNLSKKIRLLIQRAEQQRDIYLSLREDLGDEERPRFRLPANLPNEPRAAAVVARNWLNLATQGNFEEYRAAVEARGMLVFRSNGYNGKWQIPKDSPIIGFNIYDVNCPLIVVKKEAAEARQTFTLMHELGHILMHRESWIDEEADLYSHQGEERQANAFAGYLLVPDQLLGQIQDNGRPAQVSQYDVWLEPFRQAWGVSGEVILRRLLDEGRLTQAHYNAYRTWRRQNVSLADDGGNRAYRHREPMHIFGDTYVRTVLEALEAQQISLSKASNYLDSLRIKDLHLLEEYYANH
jgi:Zn-dependent peptidase ImmA (M78 family)/plasmid maintenance system antidote protein VapI